MFLSIWRGPKKLKETIVQVLCETKRWWFKTAWRWWTLNCKMLGWSFWYCPRLQSTNFQFEVPHWSLICLESSPFGFPGRHAKMKMLHDYAGMFLSIWGGPKKLKETFVQVLCENKHWWFKTAWRWWTLNWKMLGRFFWYGPRLQSTNFQFEVPHPWPVLNFSLFGFQGCILKIKMSGLFTFTFCLGQSEVVEVVVVIGAGGGTQSAPRTKTAADGADTTTGIDGIEGMWWPTPPAGARKKSVHCCQPTLLKQIEGNNVNFHMVSSFPELDRQLVAAWWSASLLPRLALLERLRLCQLMWSSMSQQLRRQMLFKHRDLVSLSWLSCWCPEAMSISKLAPLCSSFCPKWMMSKINQI